MQRENTNEIAVLETGLRQQEAVRLYQKNGYQLTENYGPYTEMPNSVCFKKRLLLILNDGQN